MERSDQPIETVVSRCARSFIQFIRVCLAANPPSFTKGRLNFLLTNTKDCDNIRNDKGCDEEGSVCHHSEKERLVKAPVMVSVFVASEPGRRKPFFGD